MKKRTEASTQHARTALLTERDLSTVIGGNDGTIIVENVTPRPQGIQGTGH
jgi:hypothetical protein